MIDLSNINKQKSIETRELIFKRDWVDRVDVIAFFIFASTAILVGVFTELIIPNDGLLTNFLLFILGPFFIIAGLYCIYRKLHENELVLVDTVLSKNENLKRLKDYLTSRNYVIAKESDDMITVLDEHMMSYNGLWRKQYVFVITEFAIYFNVRKLYPIISPPVLFGHLLLKREIEKLFL